IAVLAGRGGIKDYGQAPLILAYVVTHHQLSGFRSGLPIDVPHVVRGVIAANTVQVIARSARVAADLTCQHRQRVIEVVQRLRLRIYQNLAGRLDLAPFLEESCWELGRYSERLYRVAAANVEFAFEPLSRAGARRDEHEMRQLAESRSYG